MPVCFFDINLKDMMGIGYLILLAGIAAICIFFAKKKKSYSGGIMETSKSPMERVIRVYDMDVARLNDAIDEFINNYAEDEEDERPSAITQDGGAIQLTFSPNLDYISMCYWVNCLVYANDYLVCANEEKKVRFKVYGWYPFGEVQMNEERMPFSNQKVMMYVDQADKECDNISFVTPDGSHYLQPFAIGNNLKSVSSGERYLEVH